MRVLVLSTWFPYPPDNGSKIRAYYLLSALARAHQVTLVAFCGKGDGLKGAFQPIPGVEIHPVYADPYANVSLPEVAKFVSPIPLVFWPSRPMQRQVEELACQKVYDAVVAIQAPAALYVQCLPGIPRVLDVDTALSYQMYEHHCRQRRVNRLRTWLSWQKAQRYEARLFRQFQACTVVSDMERLHLSAMVEGADCRVQVISNGVDCAYHQPGQVRAESRNLVFHGALTYRANYDAMFFFLSEIYPLIRRLAPDVSLTITGSTSGVDMSGLRLDPSVHLTGYVEDIRPWVAGAAVCITPLREGGGTRLKILEAMALGTPVVSTSKGAEGLALTEGKHLVLADSPQAFADNTVRLLRDPAWRQRLATDARCLVEQHYDWSQIGQQFVGLVEEVTEAHAKGVGGS